MAFPPCHASFHCPCLQEAWIVGDKIGMDLKKNPPYVQDAAGLRAQLEESLARLGTTYVDILYLNRPDPRVPIEDTWRVMAEFQREGKAKYIGLSEASPEELRRAHAVAPVTAIQQVGAEGGLCACC